MSRTRELAVLILGRCRGPTSLRKAGENLQTPRLQGIPCGSEVLGQQASGLGNSRPLGNFRCNKEAQGKLAFRREATSSCLVTLLAGFPIRYTGQPRCHRRDVCFPRRTEQNKNRNKKKSQTLSHISGTVSIIRTEVGSTVARLHTM